MIEDAYIALHAALQVLLREAGWLPIDGRLELDPEAPFEPDGEEEGLFTAAALVKVSTQVARQIMGRPQRRYVVERQARLELAIGGPGDVVQRAAIEAATLAALALLPEISPTLNGVAERLLLVEREDDELPPNGARIFVTFLIRVRSGDTLGLSA